MAPLCQSYLILGRWTGRVAEPAIFGQAMILLGRVLGLRSGKPGIIDADLPKLPMGRGVIGGLLYGQFEQCLALVVAPGQLVFQGRPDQICGRRVSRGRGLPRRFRPAIASRQ